jgi:hypothetical protein
MPTPPLSESTLRRTVKVAEECGYNRAEAGRRLKLSSATVRRHLEEAERRGIIEAVPLSPKDRRPTIRSAPDALLGFPTLPDDELPADELVSLMKGQFQRKHRAHRARKWFDVSVNMPGPIGVMWFGDPHVDNDGCNWPLLDEHARICRETEGMFAANIGDTTDNWVGRLQRLYADSNQSRSRAVRLAEIFISEMGIDWLLILRGNHDMWSKSRKDDPLTWFKRGGAPMEDWQAKFCLRFPNERRARIWAAHDFPGHSWFNPLHGAKRAELRGNDAHLYVCGHKHNWAIQCQENSDTNRVSWFARARGYKYIDHHGENLGHEAQQEGAAIVSIFDPEAVSESAFVQCFSDPGEAAKYLTWKRSRSR